MKFSLIVLVVALFSACSVMTSTHAPMPVEQNLSKEAVSISIFALDNYTDTPQAGMRAANIVEGVLLSKGYTLSNNIRANKSDLSTKVEIAIKNHSDYILLGGVSEWRYKTGIDGEPAVSLQLRLLETNTSKIIWSATASDNSWGNASIGTTAQSLIDSMLTN